ncbi:Lnb N-terminal periplasmic domain-containing protein [Gluconobacter morbifer]|uniref:Lnb N-terminal periplasmic domain-containing protein n=1 Tax=Gluconobacter morbifer G707 TaxID=1088869 RepID=G6XHI6_9PROT|nr:DUF4105 domain-containing protein [Gluconobacter morbifer]EHH69644.1 hypothetical protein GMO_09520 [Gluconobacter morbifer G707]
MKRDDPALHWFRANWIASICFAILVLFGTASLYYSTIEPAGLRNGLTVCFPLLGVALLRVRRYRAGKIALLVFTGGWLTWYLTDPPRNKRDWAGEYAVPADVTMENRLVHVRHVRNFIYQTPSLYTPRYYDANYNLDDLNAVDLVTSYWAGNSIAHVFLSFGFRNGRHLAISIETRRQKAFGYSTIAGFFHHYEVFYVTADERDLIGVRTDIRKERVYLYRVRLSAAARERLFLSYLTEIDRLKQHPAWYNTLTDNCTTGILTRAQARLRYRLDWRVLLSGYTASLAYDLGLLDTQMPFPELKRRSRIRRPDHATPGPDYSREIRVGLPMETP